MLNYMQIKSEFRERQPIGVSEDSSRWSYFSDFPLIYDPSLSLSFSADTAGGSKESWRYSIRWQEHLLGPVMWWSVWVCVCDVLVQGKMLKATHWIINQSCDKPVFFCKLTETRRNWPCVENSRISSILNTVIYILNNIIYILHTDKS